MQNSESKKISQEDLKKFFDQVEKIDMDFANAQADSLGSKETDTVPNEDDPEIEFDMTPEQLEAYLQEYVVRQDDAIEVLATKIATHFRRMKWEKAEGENLKRIPGQIKPNIMMIGPTGVGKTYIIKLIADKLGVPFVKGDATKFSETGYVGGDVEDLVRDLVKVANGNIKSAEHGIIYIDEIDKIAASRGVSGPDVSRTGVQRNLLKMMEETEVELRVPHDLASQMEAVIETQRSGKAPNKKVNTRNILFIVSGAFSGLDDIIKKRLNRQPIGFGSDVDKTTVAHDEIIAQVRTQDLIEYGFESEFIGRLPVIAHLHELDVEGLFEVLTNEYNAVTQGKIRDFASYGIDLEFEKKALRKIAELAYEEKTGARGLTRVVEKGLTPFEKRLPSTSIKKLRFELEMMEDPKASCSKLVTGGTVKQAIETFEEKTGMELTISPAAYTWLEKNSEANKTAGEMLTSRLAGFEYAFNLLKNDTLQVTAKLLDKPKEYLENLIKKEYKKDDE